METKNRTFQKNGSMGVVQFSTGGNNSFNYISGTRAMEQNFVQVRESGEGNVNKITLFNLSDKYIFFMNGDLLTGAKQNRILNTSVLLAPNSKVDISVSCVEQGRWSSSFGHFSVSDNAAPPKLRTNSVKAVNLNMSLNLGRSTNQAAVWDDVRNYVHAFECKTPTSDLNEIYKQKKNDIDEFLSRFSPDEKANGLAIFTDNNLLCTDAFNSTDVYQDYFQKLIKSAALEILNLKPKVNSLTEAEAFYKTDELFDILKKIEKKEYPGSGIGTEYRFDTKEVTGFKLEYKRQLIHLTALVVTN
jgi:hypothetical protein